MQAPCFARHAAASQWPAAHLQHLCRRSARPNAHWPHACARLALACFWNTRLTSERQVQLAIPHAELLSCRRNKQARSDAGRCPGADPPCRQMHSMPRHDMAIPPEECSSLIN
eukprot:349660-Chlamydomonas_euryale.AAC.8